MQNRQLQTWLSEDEYAQIEAKWDVQKQFRGATEPGELDVLIDQQAQCGSEGQVNRKTEGRV